MGLGLNLYNVPSATTAERLRSVASTYPEATGVRMLRFLWAYGVGGLVNKDLAQRARDWTVHRYSMAVPLERKKSFFEGATPVDGIGLRELQGTLQKTKHQRSCDTNVGLWSAEFALYGKMT